MVTGLTLSLTYYIRPIQNYVAPPTVDEYLKSYLAHSKANAVIVMEAENRELALRVSSMEVQRDGIFLRFSESGREDLVRHLNVVTDTYDGLSERESFEGVCSSTLPSVSSADVSIEMVDMTRNVPDSQSWAHRSLKSLFRSSLLSEPSF